MGFPQSAFSALLFFQAESTKLFEPANDCWIAVAETRGKSLGVSPQSIRCQFGIDIPAICQGRQIHVSSCRITRMFDGEWLLIIAGGHVEWTQARPRR